MINEADLIKEEQSWKSQKELIKRQQKLKKEKDEILNTKKKTSTTKLIILFLFINCTIIELFTGWATVQSLNLAATTGSMVDFSPLITLIGTVVGEVVGFGVYALKSAKENSVGGIVHDSAMYQIEHDTKTVG